MGLITEIIQNLIARIRASRRGGGGGGGYGRGRSGRAPKPQKSPEQLAQEAAFKSEMKGGLYDDDPASLIPALREQINSIESWNTGRFQGVGGKLIKPPE